MNKFFKRVISIFIICILMFSSSIGNINFNVKALENIEPITVTEYIECSIYSNKGISLFSRGVYTDCYGDQLNASAKEMYDNFVDYYVYERNNGENTQTLVNSYTFYTTVSNNQIVLNSAYEDVVSNMRCDFDAAMSALLYDYPEIFWFRGMSLSYTIIGLEFFGNKLKCGLSDLTFTPTEIATGYSFNISKFDNEVEKTFQLLKSQFTESTTLENKLKVIHDYICKNSYYSYSGVGVDLRVHSPAPFFIGDGGIVCEGYAKVFKILCDKFDIPCVCVSGVAYDNNGIPQPHMWNYVKMDDNKWYLVDITWDDQESKIYYNYFLANSNSIGFNGYVGEERVEDGDLSGSGYNNFHYPNLSSTEYQPIVQKIYGDVNYDGVANIKDLVRLKKILVDICESEGNFPDINNDGFINSLDLSEIRNIIMIVVS